MRYRRGFIALSDERDVPMLALIRNARAITASQICMLSLSFGSEVCRRSVHWRLTRFEQKGLIERIDCGRLLSEPAYGISRSGLQLLEMRGRALVALPSTAREIVRRSQVLHSVEIAAVCASLAGAGLLKSWQWEPEVASRNLVDAGSNTKDFDAVAEISVDGETRQIAIEFERTAKGSARYEALRRVLNAEPKIDTILYLAPDLSILYLLAVELRAVGKRIGFALSRALCTDLLTTRILTNSAANDVVSFREFLIG